MGVGVEHRVETLNVFAQCCWRKSGGVSITTTRPSNSISRLGRVRLSRGSVDLQTGHSQARRGTPVEVPVPRNVSLIGLCVSKWFWTSTKLMRSSYSTSSSIRLSSSVRLPRVFSCRTSSRSMVRRAFTKSVGMRSPPVQGGRPSWNITVGAEIGNKGGETGGALALSRFFFRLTLANGHWAASLRLRRSVFRRRGPQDAGRVLPLGDVAFLPARTAFGKIAPVNHLESC